MSPDYRTNPSKMTVRKVMCPTCHAKPGAPCMRRKKSTGEVIARSANHQERSEEYVKVSRREKVW